LKFDEKSTSMPQIKYIMKLKSYFSILLVVILFSTSCKKEDVIIYEAGNQEFGWATGTKSCEDWEASGYWQYHQSDSTLVGVTFATYTSYGAERESFSLNEIPLSVGTYPIGGSSSDIGDGLVGGSYGMSGDDGDTHLGSLKVNEDKNGCITVSEIDMSTKTIKGSFQVFFISDSGGLKVEIKNGEFEVRLYE